MSDVDMNVIYSLCRYMKVIFLGSLVMVISMQ